MVKFLGYNLKGYLADKLSAQDQILKRPLKQKTSSNSTEGLGGDSAGTRTQDPYIKSVMLYQLSYGIVVTTNM
jgi:hypothetical protein